MSFFRSCLVFATALTVMNITVARATAPDAACIKPELEKFMEEAKQAIEENGDSYYPGLGATFLAAKDGPQDIQWMGADWGGPIAGALFVLDCQGNRLAGMKLGGEIKLRTGPDTPIGKTVEVIFTPGTASGVQWADVAIARFTGTSIDILWTHTATESVAAMDDDYEDAYQWVFSPDAKKITVTGARKVGDSEDKKHGWEAHTTHALPTETFCWNDNEMKFLACK